MADSANGRQTGVGRKKLHPAATCDLSYWRDHDSTPFPSFPPPPHTCPFSVLSPHLSSGLASLSPPPSCVTYDSATYSSTSFIIRSHTCLASPPHLYISATSIDSPVHHTCTPVLPSLTYQASLHTCTSLLPSFIVPLVYTFSLALYCTGLPSLVSPLHLPHIFTPAKTSFPLFHLPLCTRVIHICHTPSHAPSS